MKIPILIHDVSKIFTNWQIWEGKSLTWIRIFRLTHINHFERFNMSLLPMINLIWTCQCCKEEAAWFDFLYVIEWLQMFDLVSLIHLIHWSSIWHKKYCMLATLYINNQFIENDFGKLNLLDWKLKWSISLVLGFKLTIYIHVLIVNIQKCWSCVAAWESVNSIDNIYLFEWLYNNSIFLIS